jgi:hypothetical protein
VVLGGDRHDGIPRCLPHAWELRARLREHLPGGLLGGWVNPYRDPAEQVGFLLEAREGLDFALTQIVSHHALAPVEAFLAEASRRGLDLPLFAGVFLYRSARRRTLDLLERFIPIPRRQVERDFRERGLRAEQIAAESLRRLREIGFTRFYLSNLETGRALPRLRRIAGLAGLPVPDAGPPPRRRRR